MEVISRNNEEELKAVLEHITPAFDLIPDAVRVVGADGRTAYINRAFLQMTGFSPTELMNQRLDEIYVEDEREKAKAIFAASLKAGRWNSILELRMRRKGGSPVMVSLNCAMLKNEKDELIGGFAVYRDMSRVERILTEPVELLNLTGSPVEILRQLPSRVATYFPGRPWVMINLIQGDYLRFAYAANVPAELMAQGGEPLEGSICSFAIQSGEFVGIGDMTADTRTRQDPCVSQYGCRGYLGYPIFNSAGKILGTICILRQNRGGFGEFDHRILKMFAKRAAMEIERMELETKAEESELELQGLVENAPLMIWRVSPDGHFLQMSRKGKKDLGYGESDVLDSSLFDLIHRDDLPALTANVTKISNPKIATGQLALQVRIRKQSGEFGTFFTTLRPVYDSTGRLKLMEGVSLEIPQEEPVS